MAEHDDKQAQDHGISEDDVIDRSKPLRGMVLCCTSIPADQRTLLAKQAEDMGAQHVFDLTSQVSHLIAGEYDTPKYRFVAKERPDVKVITTEFVEAVRQLWLNDKPVPLKALEKHHLRPTLEGIRVCVTGFDDPAERTAIADLVRKNGAEYSGDLTKAITHLITFRTSGEKYKHALNWGLHVVALEWLHDSLERGMILDEKLYNPQFPKDQRGVGAWRKEKLERSPLGKRARDASFVAADEGKRKLRRTASTKLRSQSESLWGDIAAGSPVIQAARSGVWDQNDPGPQLTAVQSFQGEQIPTIPPPPYTMLAPQVARGIFHQLRFILYGFQAPKIAILERHISSHDGELSVDVDEITQSSQVDGDRENYILVPQDLPIPDIPKQNTTRPPMPIVTEFWIERCINQKALFDPSMHVLGQPMRRSKIPGFQDLILCSTGFNSLDLMHIKKIIPVLGATYDEFLTNKTGILLFNPEALPIRSDKQMSARVWDVKMINVKWLWDCIRHGEMKAAGGYLYQPERPSTVDSSRRKSAQAFDANASPAVRPVHAESGLRRSKSDLAVRPLERSFSSPAIKSKLEGSIFQQNTSKSKEESAAPAPNTRNHESNPPLAEISTNSSTKNSLPKQAQIPQQEINNVITSIMSKRPSSANSNDPNDKRRTGRIFGRAASNMSTGSRGRESSVDSTASHGNPVQWPERNPSNTDGWDSDVPPQTQMQWVEDEGAEIKERVVARMMGETVERKGIKERAVTLGDINSAPRRGGRRPGR